MPRIPDELLAQIKASVSLERLALAAGVTLKRSGNNRRGKCPFHEDRGPSLVIEPAKNLWKCFGACATGGDVIAWVQRARGGISFRHAVELLKADLPALLASGSAVLPIKHASVPQLPPVVSLSADDFELLDQVAGFYHKHLLESPHALDYLQARGLGDAETLAHFRIGFVDRTLGLTVPGNNRQSGAALRTRLKALSILRPTGHEYFRGCFTVPLVDEEGRITSFYGRRLALSAKEKARKTNPKVAAAVAAAEAAGVASPDDLLAHLPHLYMPGPHRAVFNVAALSATDEVILAECPFDALTFWAAGFKNVICAYGTNGFTAIHRDALRRHATKRVLIAYDNDGAGNLAADKLALELMATGVECFRIQLPRGIDVNEYASKLKPARKTLEIAIRSALWLGSGTAPDRPTPGGASPAHATPAGSSAPADPECFERKRDSRLIASPPLPPPFAACLSDQPPRLTSPAAGLEAIDRALASTLASALELTPEDPNASQERLTPDEVAMLTLPAHLAPPASPVPAPAAPPELTIESEGEATLTRGDRTYRIRGLATNTRIDTLRVNLLASSPLGVHVDTLDLFADKARATFERRAALELGYPEAVLHADLLALLRAADDLQNAALKKAHPTKDPVPTISDTGRAEALALLKDPQLVRRILDDFIAAGVVGEKTNTLVGYLAAISRKLAHPLALIVQSSSSAGKSTLMDAILDFVPEEDRVQFSAMTGQALFYMGETNLAHKVLAIVEEEGAERASYALKLLQSEGKLTIASTGKDPATGKLITHQYSVTGPVMIFLTTTASDLDDELANRCLILSVNEERSQTRAIHDRQRQSRSLLGLLVDNTKAQLQKLHQNAQRLIRPLPVVNPFVHYLTFVDDKTRTRRDHEKYLTLIDTIALLHQHQREVKSVTQRGVTVSYIEVTLDDIRLANQLAHDVLGRSLDELPPQTRRLLSHLDALVAQACDHLECERTDFRFTRKEIRDFTGWTDFQVRTHLDKLVNLEFLLVHRGQRGASFVYELLYDGGGSDGKPYLMGLLDVDHLADALANGHEYVPKFEGAKPKFEPPKDQFEIGSSPERAPDVAGSRPIESLEKPHEESDSREPVPETAKTTDPVERPRTYSPPVRRRGLAAVARAPRTPPPGGNGGSHPRRRPTEPEEA